MWDLILFFFYQTNIYMEYKLLTREYLDFTGTLFSYLVHDEHKLSTLKKNSDMSRQSIQAFI